MKLSLSQVACCAFVVLGATSVKAAPVDFGFPPPGNVTWTNNGADAGNLGGTINFYSNFNTAAYDQLWFGVNWIDMGTSGQVFDLTTIGVYGSNTETWSGLFTIDTLNGPRTATGTFTATLSNGTWIDPNSVGITGPGAPLAVTDVTGNFNVTESFTVAGEAFNTWYNGFNTLGIQDQTDFGGDFWATPPMTNASATPLPAALPLFATGLGAFGLLGWRRKRRTVA